MNIYFATGIFILADKTKQEGSSRKQTRKYRENVVKRGAQPKRGYVYIHTNRTYPVGVEIAVEEVTMRVPLRRSIRRVRATIGVTLFCLLRQYF